MKEKKAAGWCFGIEYGGSDCLSESYMNAGKEKMRPSLLLHSCCGPCSTSVIERLAPDYEITVFYYNPCITDNGEYIKRRAEGREFGFFHFNIDIYHGPCASKRLVGCNALCYCILAVMLFTLCK